MTARGSLTSGGINFTLVGNTLFFSGDDGNTYALASVGGGSGGGVQHYTYEDNPVANLTLTNAYQTLASKVIAAQAGASGMSIMVGFEVTPDATVDDLSGTVLFIIKRDATQIYPTDNTQTGNSGFVTGADGAKRVAFVALDTAAGAAAGGTYTLQIKKTTGDPAVVAFNPTLDFTRFL